MSDLPQKQRIIVQAAEPQWERELNKSIENANRMGSEVIDVIRNRLDYIGRDDETYRDILMEVLGELGHGRMPNKQALRMKLARYKLELQRYEKSRPGVFD